MSKAKDNNFKQFQRNEKRVHFNQRQIADELSAEGKEAIQNRNQKH
jgi:hypothetical protein